MFHGLFRPKRVKVLGFEFSGVVGDQAMMLGDLIEATLCSRMPVWNFAAYAEYKCLPEIGNTKWAWSHKKPVNLGYQEAAAMPLASLTALLFLRKKGNIQRGQAVLIYGASGSVDSYAVQLAKHFGAEVTGVCGTDNIDVVKDLSADHVNGYMKDKFARHEYSYDIVFDSVAKCPRSRCRKLLKKNGRYFTTFQSAQHPNRS